MKKSKLIMIAAIVLAVTSAFAFKPNAKNEKLALGTQVVYYSPGDCTHSATCSDSGDNVCVLNQTMYDDQNTCTIKSAYKFLPQ